MASIIKSAVRVALGWRRSGKTSFPAGTPTFTLLPLSLSGALSNGTPSSGTIVGGTVGSQITSANVPNGLVISGLKYTWSGAGSGTGAFTITETNPQASNSPRTSTVNYSIGVGLPSPPVLTGNPVISGNSQVGQTLTATHGTYTGTVTSYTGQWYSGASPIALATGLTYVPVSGDVGNLITYKESAYNTSLTYSSATGTSNALGPITVLVTLGTLTFSGTTFTTGTPSSGTITGATSLSAITATGLPTGLTINGGARTWSWDGTGTASTGSFTLTETLAGATNTPHNSTISFTISSSGGLGGAGTLGAPTIGYPSPLASNPATIPVHVPVDWQSGDVLKLARSSSVAMTSPTILTHTLIDADIGGTVSIGLSGVTLSGITYFQALGSHSGVDSANLSNIVTWGDTTAPTITTSATQSVTEQTPLAVALTGTDTGGIASWSIVGGADQLQFQIVGTTLQWFGNGTEAYLSPANVPPNSANPYNVTVQATDYGGNVSTKAIAVTVTQIDTNPDAYSFTAVNNATLSTVYTSNTVTISGLQPGFNISSSLSGTGFTYSKNGGAYQAPGSFTVVNGDTITLKVTSASGNNTAETGVLTIGIGINAQSSWTVTTPITTTTFDPSGLAGSLSLTNGNLTVTHAGTTTGAVKTVNGYSTGKHVVRFHIDVAGGGSALEAITEPNNNNPTTNCAIFGDGSLWLPAGYSGLNVGAPIAGDTIDIAFDMDAKKAWFRKNTTWEGSGGDPTASGVGFDISAMAATLYPAFVSNTASAATTLQAVTVTGFASVI